MSRVKPIYARIQEHVRGAIDDGTLPPGARLWTETELAEKFGTTRATVRHALDQLVFEGLVTRQAGRGSFVTQRSSIHAPIDQRRCLSFEEQLGALGKAVTYRSVNYTLAKATAPIAERLSIPPGSNIFHLERVRVVDERPVCVENRYIPQSIGAEVTGEMLSSEPAHTFVGAIVGEQLPTILVSITAEIADARAKRLLDLTGTAAVSVRTSTHHDSAGRVVLVGRCIFAGNVSTDYVLGLPLND